MLHYTEKRVSKNRFTVPNVIRKIINTDCILNVKMCEEQILIKSKFRLDLPTHVTAVHI